MKHDYQVVEAKTVQIKPLRKHWNIHALGHITFVLVRSNGGGGGNKQNIPFEGNWRKVG